MNDPERWLLIKLVLVQAHIILEKMERAMHEKRRSFKSPPLQIDGITEEDLYDAKNCIANIVNDEEALIQAAQNQEFQSLVNELQSAGMEITQEDIDLAKRWQSKRTFLDRFLNLFH